MAETAAFYGLKDWVWDLLRADRAVYVSRHRPFVGFNPALERVTNGDDA